MKYKLYLNISKKNNKIILFLNKTILLSNMILKKDKMINNNISKKINNYLIYLKILRQIGLIKKIKNTNYY